VWWENAPLIIQEAFANRRPVICSNIGGMAEMVRDGVDGLHFQAGDPADLARTMKRAATTPQLWQRLSAAIAAPRTVAAAADEHLDFYRELLSGVAAAPAPVKAVVPPRRWTNPVRPESRP
jgi:glycosyltransferase involved in cell wall biosynthesis